MRIATFNILSGRSPTDDDADEERFARAVSALDPDLLALQEVDSNQPRSKHADQTQIAARAMAASDHRFVAVLSGTPGAAWTAATGESQPDEASYGVAFLSRYPVVGWRVIRLPGLPARVPHRFPGRWRPTLVRDEPRAALVADVEAPRGRLRVVTTHLSYLPWWNGHQLGALMRELGEAPVPTLLLGDLNMGPQRAQRLTRMRSLAAGRTFPADRPVAQLDHLLVRGDLTATTGGPVHLPMSDHRALVAEVA